MCMGPPARAGAARRYGGMGAAGRARATLSPNCPKLLDAHRGLLERVQLANIERVAAEALGSRHASFEQELPRRCQLALELIDSLGQRAVAFAPPHDDGPLSGLSAARNSTNRHDETSSCR